MDDDHRHSLPGGLPPLPKSLSAAMGSSAASSVTHSGNASPLLNHPNHFQADAEELFLGASTSAAAAASRVRQNHHHQQRHGSLSSTQESLSDRESVQSRASSTHSSHQHTPTNNNGSQLNTLSGAVVAVAASAAAASPSSCASNDVAGNTLNTQLAILRREMYGLRQLDLNLLSQLWALNESIQGFRVFLQEQDALSPPSPSSPTPSDSNSLTSDPEDESFAAPPKVMPTSVPPVQQLLGPCGSTTSHASTSSNSGTSGSSSAASSMGKHGSMLAAHLQQQQQQHLLNHKQQQQQQHYQQQQQPVPPQPNRSHPQLPRILQQRMRRAPPPPPPATGRPKSHSKSPASGSVTVSSPSNSSIGSMAAQMAAMPMPTDGAKQRPV